MTARLRGWWHRPPTPTQIERRLGKLPSSEIQVWCESAALEANRFVGSDLVTAETAARVLLSGIQELRRRQF